MGRKYIEAPEQVNREEAIRRFDSLFEQGEEISHAPRSVIQKGEGAPEAAYNRLKFWETTWVVIGCLVFVGGVAAQPLLNLFLDGADVPYYPIGATVIIFSVWSLSMANKRLARFSQKHIGSRVAYLEAFSKGAKIHWVGIEDPSSFDRRKIIGDDLGGVAVDVESQSVLIEGVRFRHLVRRVDALELKMIHSGMSCAICLKYDVAGVPVELALSESNLIADARRTIFGEPKNSLFTRMQDALGKPKLQPVAYQPPLHVALQPQAQQQISAPSPMAMPQAAPPPLPRGHLAGQ